MDYQRMNEIRSLDEVTFELETFSNNLKVICNNGNEYLVEFCLTQVPRSLPASIGGR